MSVKDGPRLNLPIYRQIVTQPVRSLSQSSTARTSLNLQIIHYFAVKVEQDIFGATVVVTSSDQSVWSVPMAASFALPKLARSLFAVMAISAALLDVLLAAAADTTDIVVVRLDQARITRLPDKVSTIVIGNPLIADVSLQAGGLLVLTGKGYGVTNLVALDRAGTVLSEFLIQVEAATDTIVVVYRGAARESYSCTPECSPRISLGDTQPYFNSTIGQTMNRIQRAQAGGAAAASGGAAR